ncbi:hypothetical protein Tco_0018609 [Tanacetum coccineum]
MLCTGDGSRHGGKLLDHKAAHGRVQFGMFNLLNVKGSLGIHRLRIDWIKRKQLGILGGDVTLCGVSIICPLCLFIAYAFAWCTFRPLSAVGYLSRSGTSTESLNNLIRDVVNDYGPSLFGFTLLKPLGCQTDVKLNYIFPYRLSSDQLDLLVSTILRMKWVNAVWGMWRE